jgi:hypothetical protein
LEEQEERRRAQAIKPSGRVLKARGRPMAASPITSPRTEKGLRVRPETHEVRVNRRARSRIEAA